MWDGNFKVIGQTSKVKLMPLDTNLTQAVMTTLKETF